MKVVLNRSPSQTLLQIGNLHNLILEISERPLPNRLRMPRFTCRFRYTEVKHEGALLVEYGEGRIIEEAIEDYCNKISNKTLVVNAMNSHRLEFDTVDVIPGTNDYTSMIEPEPERAFLTPVSY